jgi:hypothetical protein
MNKTKAFLATLLRTRDHEQVDSLCVPAADIHEARRIARSEFHARYGRVPGYVVHVRPKCAHQETYETTERKVWTRACRDCHEVFDAAFADEPSGMRPRQEPPA